METIIEEKSEEEETDIEIMLDEQEVSDLVESFDTILCETLDENFDYIQMQNYDFDNHLQDIIIKNFNHLIYSNIDYEDHIKNNYDEHIESLHINNGLIKRSYKTRQSLEYFNENHIPCQEQVEYLMTVPQPEQRTQEWYDFRYNHITGSNAWKIFGNNSTKNQLFYEKLQPQELTISPKKFSNMSDNPLNWGHKYEPLSIMLYEYYNNVTVSDFGCIPHKNIPFLAASPDGIVTSNKLNGRMVEIKNVVSREITQIPKMEYYVQMQMQMEVCDLDSCDFVETKFVEYDSFHDFEQDKCKYEKGMICVILDKTEEMSKFIYEYAPLFENNNEQMDEFTKGVYKKYNIDETNDTSIDQRYSWFKNIYWKLDVYSCVYIPRNKQWFDEAILSFKDFWNTIIEERKTPDAYLKYKPKTRQKKNNDEKDNTKLKIVKMNNYMENKNNIIDLNNLN